LRAPSADSSLASTHDDRWRAYLSSDDEVVVYCPDCAAREFDVSKDDEFKDVEKYFGPGQRATLPLSKVFCPCRNVVESDVCCCYGEQERKRPHLADRDLDCEQVPLFDEARANGA
jgi:hypothetical protein